MFWLLTQPYYLAFINHGSEMIMQVKIQNLFFLTRPRTLTQDFAGGSDEASACNAGDPGSIPGLGRFPWRRKEQPTPVLLPGKSYGQRNLVGYSPWGHKELDMTE